ncbi:hypothetical protein ABIC60_004107 [Phyllobacterium ifriqiyense]
MSKGLSETLATNNRASKMIEGASPAATTNTRHGSFDVYRERSINVSNRSCTASGWVSKRTLLSA